MIDNLITIELKPEEAIKFRVFVEHYSLFEKLIDAELHKAQHPQYLLYFNKFGDLKGIEAKHVIYEKS